MICDMCHRRDAVHEIDGYRVCADSRCKYLAWEADVMALRGRPKAQRSANYQAAERYMKELRERRKKEKL